MKISVPEAARSMEINMLPMINIIFLLLVFVLLAGGAARLPHPDPGTPPPVTATFGADGLLRLNGAVTPAAELAAQLHGAGLQLHADPALPVPVLVSVLKALHVAGLQRLQLASQ